MKHLTTYKVFELLSLRDNFARASVFPNDYIVFPNDRIQNIINDILIDLMDDGIDVELTPHPNYRSFTLTVGDITKDNQLISWKDIRGYAQHLIESLSEEGIKLTGIHIGTFTYSSFEEVEDCVDKPTPEGKELERPHSFYFYFEMQ